jgi:hypothetical protein
VDPLLVIHVHFLVGHPRGVLDDHPAEQVYDDGDDGLAEDVFYSGWNRTVLAYAATSYMLVKI